MDVLTGLKRADAAIVGAGLTGLLLGAALAQEGMQVALIDAGDGSVPLPHSAACLPSDDQLARAEAVHGTETARLYAQALQVQLHALLVSPLPYVQRTPLYAYAQFPADLPLLEARLALYERLQLSAHLAPDAGGCPFPVELSLLLPGQAVVNMPRWAAALKGSIRRSGGRIYTGSRVTAFDGPRVCTERGCVHAPLVILTAGAPLGLRSEEMLECRSEIHCLLTGGPLHSIQRSLRADGLHLCPTPRGMIASLDAGRCGTRKQAQRLAQADAAFRHALPDYQRLEISHTRSNISWDGLPLIGALPGTRRLCAAGADGILGAMHAAAVLTRHILGRALPEDAPYSPSRKLPLRHLGKIHRCNALVRASNGLRITAPSCAHCGCRLRYTPSLALWECPLCGSAFTMMGQPMYGPSLSSAVISPHQRPN